VSDPGATFPTMVAVSWAAIGLLAATLLGSLYYLGARIDGLSGRIDGLSGRIDALSGRIDTLDARLSARIDALAARMDAHIERHAG
jgi:outer membrane murein-binding lipoprotein Lpp